MAAEVNSVGHASFAFEFGSVMLSLIILCSVWKIFLSMLDCLGVGLVTAYFIVLVVAFFVPSCVLDMTKDMEAEI